MFDYSSRLCFSQRTLFILFHGTTLGNKMWDRLIPNISNLWTTSMRLCVYASCPKFWPIPQWCWRFFSAAAVLLSFWAPLAGWFIREHPIKMDDLWWFGGTPISGKPPIYWRWSKEIKIHEGIPMNQPIFHGHDELASFRWFSLTPRHFWKFTSWPRQWHSFRVVFPFPARPRVHALRFFGAWCCGDCLKMGPEIHEMVSHGLSLSYLSIAIWRFDPNFFTTWLDAHPSQTSSTHVGFVDLGHKGMSENGVYPQWNSHLIGIMISKTIGFRGTQHFQSNPQFVHMPGPF